MADLDTLKSLRERVLAATGPDQSLSDDINFALGCKPREFWWTVPWGMQPEWAQPPVTHSIDAALGLVERMLPGWAWALAHLPNQPVLAQIAADGGGAGENKGAAATPPLAILAALLSALIAKEVA